MTATVKEEGPRQVIRPWGRVCIGIQVTCDHIRLVETVAGRVTRRVEVGGATSVEEVGTSVSGVLALVSRSSRFAPTPTVVIALGAGLMQCKRIFGLPAVENQRVATGLVRESASRFFRSTTATLVTSEALLAADGSVRAAALSGALMHDLKRVTTARGTHLRAIVPFEALSEMEAAGAHTGSEDFALLAAGAAGKRDALRFNALGTAASRRTATQAEVRLALAALSVSLSLAIASPLILGGWRRANDRDSRVALGAQEESALRVAQELAAVSEGLLEISRYDSDSRSAIGVLAHISRALPAGGAITDLRIDSAGGSITALTPSADAFLRGLAASPLFDSPTVVGAVTRERSEERDLERVSLRFRHREHTPGTRP